MKIKYGLLSKIKIIHLLGMFFFIFSACENSKNIEDEVVDFQAKIDSLLIDVVVPMQREIDTSIFTYNSEGKDTFQLARQRIPIQKVQFLISNEYFELDKALEDYAGRKIDAATLAKQLKQSQIRVDSLINYDLKMINDSSVIGKE